ncbi:MAG TPA: hypothetical protein VIZ90_17875, partial [Rhizobiaceae bacterium]
RPFDNGSLHTALRIGADAVFADNGDVSAILLGETLDFSVGGKDTVRGFAGIDLSYRADGGASFSLGAEAGYDTGNATTFDLRGGLQIAL